MDPRELTAYELLQLCLDVNDKAAWTEFVRRFRSLIAGVVVKRCRRHTGRIPNPSLIDDLTQDTYVKLCANDLKALRTFDFRHENAFFGFLKTVAEHVVEDYFRRPHEPDPGPEEDDSDHRSDGPAAPPVPIERNILIGQIDKCLQSQASEPNFARDYLIFWLYFRQGLTAKAIAELPSMRLTVKGVESTLFRLSRIVREKLGETPGRKRASGA